MTIIEKLGIKSEYETSMVNGDIVLKLENQRNELLKALIELLRFDDEMEFLEAIGNAALAVEKMTGKTISEITEIYNALA